MVLDNPPLTAERVSPHGEHLPPLIHLRCNCDFFEAESNGLLPEYSFLVYTGPIDSYFAAQGLAKLEYRSIFFEEEFLEDPSKSARDHLQETNPKDSGARAYCDEEKTTRESSTHISSPSSASGIEDSNSENLSDFFQPAMVVNYPGSDVPYTRIVEYKHVPNQTRQVLDGKVKGTLI